MAWWRRKPKDPAELAQEQEEELVGAFHMADFGGRSRTVRVYYERHHATLEHTIEVARENGYEFVRTKHDRMGRAAEFRLKGAS